MLAISTLDLRPLILRWLASCKAHLFQYNPNFVKWAHGGQKGIRLQPLETTEVKKKLLERGRLWREVETGSLERADEGTERIEKKEKHGHGQHLGARAAFPLSAMNQEQ